MKWIYTVLILLAVCAFVVGQSAQPKIDDAELAVKVTKYLQPLNDAGELSGTLLIARGPNVIFEKSYGMSNFELNVNNTPHTRFCIASVSKPITQIILFNLLENGKLDLKDPISKWFPDFPRGKEITVEHLYSHSSGIPHRITTHADESVAHTPADMVEFAKKAKLVYEPGSQSTYSSGGYSVLARILELASGESYEKLLQRIVLKPVSAEQTVHPFGRNLIPNKANGYFRSYNSVLNSPLQDLSFLVGAGSLFSTARDLHKIAHGLVVSTYGDRIKTNMMRKEGLRWAGYTNGYRAFVNYDLAQDMYVIFAGNLFSGAGDLIGPSIKRLASGESIPPPEVPKVTPFDLSRDDQKKHEGVYELGPGQTEELRFMSPNVATLGDWVLISNGKDQFFSPQDYNVVHSVAGADGSTTALQWGEPGQGPRFSKVSKLK